jgi:hypothetical protein
MQINVEAMCAKNSGETIYEYSTLAIWNDSVKIQYHRNLSRASRVTGVQGSIEEVAVEFAAILHALSRTDPAHGYLPKRSLDPVGIKCADRWMWTLAHQDVLR